MAELAEETRIQELVVQEDPAAEAQEKRTLAELLLLLVHKEMMVVLKGHPHLVQVMLVLVAEEKELLVQAQMAVLVLVVLVQQIQFQVLQ